VLTLDYPEMTMDDAYRIKVIEKTAAKWSSSIKNPGTVLPLE